ncbi:hypothetical protein CHS0354_025398 [Potamilus streckersoni]|uniref:Uncharacterized protein n=1 Tax=Potamilus streckersoni TaxID=2493646 RepID=A0AAE0SQ46_9BIVA|nr:hypothetical protein CHS0354_025398 [Potamilus streckersoni]
MQGVNTTTPHLPMLSDRFYLESSVPREPPEHSWNRLQRVLIDYPRDKHLLHRQTLWNFHKINRGAFRSQVCSLPDIPFRYKRTFRDCRSIGVQTDKSEYDLDRHKFERPCLYLPRINEPESNDISSPQRSIRPPGPLVSPEILRRTSRTSFDSLSKITERDLCIDIDTETVRKTVDSGTMTDFEPIRRKKKMLKTKKTKTPIINTQSKITNAIIIDRDANGIETRKSVKFVDKMDKSTETSLEQEQKESEIVPTPVSMSSAHSGASANIYAENVGSSSQFTLGDPLSVVDFLSKASDGCSSDHDKSSSDKNHGAIGKKRKKYKEINYNEADRIWFEKIAGDKEVVDLSAYDNFARTRPTLETVPEMNDKLPKTTLTPRISGEYKLARPNAVNKYSPVFSKDGTPVKKVGGGGGGVTPKTSKIAKARQVVAKSF